MHCIIHLQMFFVYACHYKLQGILCLFFLCGEVVLPFLFPFWEGKRGGGETRSNIWREWIQALRIEGEQLCSSSKGSRTSQNVRDGGVLNKRRIEAGIAQCRNSNSALNLSCPIVSKSEENSEEGMKWNSKIRKKFCIFLVILKGK